MPSRGRAPLLPSHGQLEASLRRDQAVVAVIADVAALARQIRLRGAPPPTDAGQLRACQLVSGVPAWRNTAGNQEIGMSQEARMIRAFLLTTATAAGFVVAGHWMPVHAQSAVVVLVDNPWKLVNKQTLPLAIVAAEKFSGGRALEAGFRVRQSVPGFDAVTAKAAAFSRVRIDIPSNVAAAIAEADVPAWMANWVLKAYAKSLAKAKLSLGDAVVKAEEIADAPAVDAAIAKPLTADNAVLAYDVEVIKNNRPERVAIDAVTGEQIENPDPVLESWTPEKALYESLKKTTR
jgi:hypothetical protein